MSAIKAFGINGIHFAKLPGVAYIIIYLQNKSLDWKD